MEIGKKAMFVIKISLIPSLRLFCGSTSMTTTKEPKSATVSDSQKIEQYADLVRHDSYPMYLWGINRGLPLADAPIESFRRYIDDFARDVFGETEDPLLRILVEQLLLSHQVIGRLSCDAFDKSSDLDVRRTNFQLATSLMGEARRQTKELLQVRKIAKDDAPQKTARTKKGGGSTSKLVSNETTDNSSAKSTAA